VHGEAVTQLLTRVDPTDDERGEVRQALQWFWDQWLFDNDRDNPLLAFLAAEPTEAQAIDEMTRALEGIDSRHPLTARALLAVLHDLQTDGELSLAELDALRRRLVGLATTDAGEALFRLVNQGMREQDIRPDVLDSFISRFEAEHPDPGQRKKEVETFLRLFGFLIPNGNLREVRRRVGLPAEDPLHGLHRMLVAANTEPELDVRQPFVDVERVGSVAAEYLNDGDRFPQVVGSLNANPSVFSDAGKVAAQLLVKAMNQLLLTHADINRLIAVFDRTESELEGLRAWRAALETHLDESAKQQIDLFIGSGGQDPSCAEGPVVPEAQCEVSAR
jgi:hypothetical protein